MRIYTRTGDDGSTGLFGGKRVSKDSARIEAYGTVDELNATLGRARASLLASGIDVLEAAYARVQAQLFDVGAVLADPTATSPGIGEDAIALLESEIDHWESELEPLQSFILPAGTAAGADLHLARTVCRRAERRTITLAATAPVHADLLGFLNRLSDHLFVAARTANRLAGTPDVAWLRQSG